MNKVDYQSEYFQLEEVADGVYAAIVRPGQGAMGNAGIVDMGDFTLVFDTFYSLDAARDLRKFAEETFSRPVKLVVNSHFHIDHVSGNQEFPHATIVSTTKTRNDMAGRLPGFIEFAKTHPEFLEQFAEAIKSETDEVLRAEMQKNLADMSAFNEMVGALSLTLPHVTFDDELTFVGTKRTAKLVCPGGGHTASDSYLYLPSDEVIFMGDLLAVENHVQFKDGDATNWIRILEQLEGLPIRTAIPGHGGVGTAEDIQRLKDYLNDAIVCATALHEQQENAKTTVDDVLSQLTIPAKYAAWAARGLYTRNIRQLLEKINSQVFVS